MVLSSLAKDRETVIEEKDEMCKEMANSSVSCAFSVAQSVTKLLTLPDLDKTRSGANSLWLCSPDASLHHQRCL